MKKYKFAILGFVFSCYCLISGCAALKECRNDLAIVGGFYCTSYVEGIGQRRLYPLRCFQNSDLICVEAELLNPCALNSSVNLENRFIIISKNGLSEYLGKNSGKITENEGGKFIYVYINPKVNWQKENIDLRTAKEWYIYPDNINDKIPESELLSFRKSMQLTPYLRKYEDGRELESKNFIFNDDKVNCMVYTYFNTLYNKPFQATCVKTILYVPALAVDIVTLPVILVVVPAYYIFLFAVN